MEKYLLPFDKKRNYSFLIGKLSTNEKFNCTDLKKLSYFLAKDLIELKPKYDFVINLTACDTHPLIFDVDVKNKPLNTFDILIEYFNNVFLNVLLEHLPLLNFTVLMSMRRDYSGGMHVHILNVEMAHDDYVHLCNLMKLKCNYEKENVVVELDCLSLACLVASDKIKNENDPYVPIQLTQYEKYFCEDEKLWKLRENISIVKSISNDIEIASLMMPVPQKNAIYLKYPTRITSSKNKCAAKFVSCINDLNYFIVKENKMVKSESNEKSLCHKFLINNAKSIDSFASFNNTVLKTWYKRYSLNNVLDTGPFQMIDRKLRKTYIHLQNEESPLNTLLRSSYSLPVFYALCNLKKNKLDSEAVILNIYKYYQIDREFPTHLPEESTHLNLNTISYCALRTPPTDAKEGFCIKLMDKGWNWIFENTLHVEDVKKYAKFIQKKHFPIVKAENGKFYSWSPTEQSWSDTNEKQVKAIYENIYSVMKSSEGFSKMSFVLQIKLKKERDWIDFIVTDILKELKDLKPIKGNYLSVADFEMHKGRFGLNVPEYYIFTN